MTKVPDAQLWDALYKTCGNFGAAATILSKELGINYQRSSVKARADKEPERLAHVKARMIDIAEHTLIVAMTQRDEDNKIMPSGVSAAKFVAGTKGRSRGYETATKVTIEGGSNPIRVARALSELDELELSIETRKELLKAIELKSAQEAIVLVEEEDEEDNESE